MMWVNTEAHREKPTVISQEYILYGEAHPFSVTMPIVPTGGDIFQPAYFSTQ